MAEFAAQLCSSLDSNQARRGLFEIDHSKGNQLAFCCNDILRRIEELIASVTAAEDLGDQMRLISLLFMRYRLRFARWRLQRCR
jgi:hypothetical protein